METLNLEGVINTVNQMINIDDEREEFTALFNKLRDVIFDVKIGLRKNKDFNSLFNGFQLEGSYGDNLKVSHPDEFDLVFLLSLPHIKKVKFQRSVDKPGYVQIDIGDVLNSLDSNLSIYALLKQWCNDANQLKVNSIISWLTGLFTKTLSELRNEMVFNGATYTLELTQQGPAQTIRVTRRDNDQFMFSVDFVAGIKIKTSKKNSFEAIPKPSSPPDPNYTLFRESYYLREHSLIHNNFNLNSALRIMKKFRDKNENMSNLKSYYIKTLFLWQCSEQNQFYWMKPLSCILIDMFTKLELSLRDKELPFRWNKNNNLFQKFDNDQSKEMLTCVSSTRKKLLDQQSNLTHPMSVYRIFLTEKEMSAPSVQQSLNSFNKPKRLFNEYCYYYYN